MPDTSLECTRHQAAFQPPSPGKTHLVHQQRLINISIILMLHNPVNSLLKAGCASEMQRSGGPVIQIEAPIKRPSQGTACGCTFGCSAELSTARAAHEIHECTRAKPGKGYLRPNASQARGLVRKAAKKTLRIALELCMLSAICPVDSDAASATELE